LARPHKSSKSSPQIRYQKGCEMRLMDYAWRLGLPPTDGSYMVARGQDWARSHGYKVSDSLALEIGVYAEDGWSAKHLNAFVKGRLPKPEPEPKLEQDVPEDESEDEPAKLLKLGEERLTKEFTLRLGETEHAAWQAYAKREDRPLAWLVRRAMRDCVEFSQFKSANEKGVDSDAA
jgi:hypothetical protein